MKTGLGCQRCKVTIRVIVEIVAIVIPRPPTIQPAAHQRRFIVS
jgi:hypothetical protein